MQVFKYLLGAAAMLVVAACANHQSSEQKILAVSIEPQRQVLEQLAGPSFKVTTLLGRGADPETFDPSTAQRVAVDRADMYFATGVLPFEKRLLESLGDDTEFVDTSEGMKLLYGTHGHSHHHGDADHGHLDADPHYWSSIEGIRVMSRNMARALSEKYPDSTALINERLVKFTSSLDSLSRVITGRIANAGHRTFAVWHPSLSYFANENGLEQLSLGTEGKELSAKELAEAIDHARADSVAVFFFQPGIDSRQAEVLSESIGSRLVPINPLDYDWRGQLILIADEISRP